MVSSAILLVVFGLLTYAVVKFRKDSTDGDREALTEALS
jgi:heme/copper-type cytochrome/quinol oxidase subunit 2